MHTHKIVLILVLCCIPFQNVFAQAGSGDDRLDSLIEEYYFTSAPVPVIPDSTEVCITDPLVSVGACGTSKDDRKGTPNYDKPYKCAGDASIEVDGGDLFPCSREALDEALAGDFKDKLEEKCEKLGEKLDSVFYRSPSPDNNKGKYHLNCNRNRQATIDVEACGICVGDDDAEPETESPASVEAESAVISSPLAMP